MTKQYEPCTQCRIRSNSAFQRLSDSETMGPTLSHECKAKIDMIGRLQDWPGSSMRAHCKISVIYTKIGGS